MREQDVQTYQELGSRGTTVPMALAYAYLRKSSVDRRDILTQHLKRVRQLAAQLHAALPEDRIYVDEDVSGDYGRAEDSAWARCWHDLQKDRPDYLLAVDYDRLGRNFTDVEQLERFARTTGLKVYTWRDGDYFNSPDWPLKVARAKSERLYTSVRVKEAHAKRRDEGKDSTGGVRPFGYTKDRMHIYEPEAALIRQAVDAILSGKSVKWVKHEIFDRSGIPHTRGGEWNLRGISRMLRRPRNAGLLTHRGEIIGKAAWPAIIAKSEWEALIKVLDSRNRAPGPKPKTLLCGVLWCGQCGTRMHGVATTWGAKSLGPIPLYRCDKKHLGGCGKTWRERALVDDAVVKAVLERVRATTVDEEWARLEAEIDAIDEEDVRLDLDIAATRTTIANGKLSREDGFPLLSEWRKRKAALARKRAALVLRQRELVGADQAAEDWDSLTVEDRRGLIHAHIKMVILHQFGKGLRRPLASGELEIIWR